MALIDYPIMKQNCQAYGSPTSFPQAISNDTQTLMLGAMNTFFGAMNTGLGFPARPNSPIFPPLLPLET